MQFDIILATIRDSDTENDWVSVTRPDGRTSTFYKNDVNLRIESSIDDEHIQAEDFKETWANNHPDSSARGYFYDIYYGSTLVQRAILVAVDGARALIPPPDFQTKEIRYFDYVIARIFDISSSLDEYISRSKLTVGAR